jgi:diaminopimelate decarboxylase
MLRNGLGAECASVEEVAHALAVGFPAHAIVYDAPAKTRSAIASAVAAGIHINLDCCDEVATVAALLAECSSSDSDANVQPVFGLRVNVLVGEGAIAGTPCIEQLHTDAWSHA